MKKIMTPSDLEKLMGMQTPEKGLLEVLAQCVLNESLFPEQAERLVAAGYIAADKEQGEGYVTTKLGNNTIKWYLPDVAQRLYDRNNEERLRKAKESTDALWRKEIGRENTS